MAQACNPGTLEVVAKEPTFKVILCYTLSSEPAWTNETVSKKKKKALVSNSKKADVAEIISPDHNTTSKWKSKEESYALCAAVSTTVRDAFWPSNFLLEMCHKIWIWL